MTLFAVTLFERTTIFNFHWRRSKWANVAKIDSEIIIIVPEIMQNCPGYVSWEQHFLWPCKLFICKSVSRFSSNQKQDKLTSNPLFLESTLNWWQSGGKNQWHRAQDHVTSRRDNKLWVDSLIDISRDHWIRVAYFIDQWPVVVVQIIFPYSGHIKLNWRLNFFFSIIIHG